MAEQRDPQHSISTEFSGPTEHARNVPRSVLSETIHRFCGELCPGRHARRRVLPSVRARGRHVSPKAKGREGSSGDEFFDVRIVDLGRDGVGIETDEPFSVGDVLTVMLADDRGTMVFSPCVVVWATRAESGGQRAGLEFEWAARGSNVEGER